MIAVPYKLLETLFPASDTDMVTIPKALLNFLLGQSIQSVDFEDQDYLRKNPDVAAALRRGEWASGREHFLSSGYFEGRSGAGLDVAESWYVRANPDVARALQNKEWTSGDAHYHNRGMYEWRSPNKKAQADVAIWKRACLGEAETETPLRFNTLTGDAIEPASKSD